MLHTARIGVRIGSADPYWVQMREAVLRHAQRPDLDLVPLALDAAALHDAEAQSTLIEALRAQELDALICTYLPEQLTVRLLAHGLPIIHLIETELTHPLLVATRGYGAMARTVGVELIARLGGRGRVLVVGGGLAAHGEDGRSRLAGIAATLHAAPGMTMEHIPSAWRYERAYVQVAAALRAWRGPLDAIFGLSDSVALAARDAAESLGLLDARTVVIGINGDPLALTAIGAGRMTATIDTPLAAFGAQVVEVACRAARRARLPAHLHYEARLVTAANVAEVALQKLGVIADLPSRLVGVNRQQEQERLAQMEISLEINRRVGAILDQQQLSREIGDLIRARYGYDAVHLWHLGDPALDEPGVLPAALHADKAIFIPDARASQRFPCDGRWPEVRARVVVPVHSGGAVRGLLDLHRHRYMPHTSDSLAGLQVIADQLGIALRNAELYGEAVAARAAAERADALKTRLLANVSHELRVPLNVILGYSQAALANADGAPLPLTLRDDLRQIARSGAHLARLMNDLLDLSRAEIDELDLFPEVISTRAFLAETFESVQASSSLAQGVALRLDLPEQLPAISADPVRLRQILFNLLSNAVTATGAGTIVLGAEAAPPHLHIWVADTGVGIAPAMQERIFEPFVSAPHAGQRPEGIGLGLSITRRLVALHHGALRLASVPGAGSTFHVDLPLPSVSQPRPAPHDEQAVLLLVAASDALPAPMLELSRRWGLRVQRVAPGDDVAALLAALRPAALAWDVGQASRADWELIQRIRSAPLSAQVPLLLYGDDAEPRVVGVLPKPLHSTALRDAIAALRWPADAGAVLIADDDAATRALYQSLVAQALPGQPVLLAEDGAAAIRLLEQHTPALVILDLMMPEVDGFAVLEHLRAQPATQHTPVIVLSGRALSLDDVRRLDHALVTVHTKDILTPAELAATVRARLAGGDRPAHATSRIVKRASAYMQQHHARDLSRQEVADAVGVSKNYLSQIFQHELGLSPWEYLNRYRVRQARLLLRGSYESVTAVAAQVGFADASYFGRVFRKQVGCSPQAYRARCATR